jgi:hypothetical protein
MSWYPNECQMIERAGAPPFTRIDRSGWPDHVDSIEGIVDSHVLRPADQPENWPRIRRLIELLIPDQLDFCDEYRERYVKGY